ncbi:MAG TPA: hypothetical protein VJ914_32180 [Pseudonocardiaceae bacterium]|nr:hypothetical protein [Pseudonocardiaceae bacterium]
MGRRRAWEDDPYHQYFTVEAVVVDREIDENTQSMLRLLPRQPDVTPTSFAATMDYEVGGNRELRAFVERTFDAWLYFENSGNREVGFRIPSDVWSTLRIPCYVTCRSFNSFDVATSGDDVLVRFQFLGDDNELFNQGESGRGWLEHVLPVRDELLAGNSGVLELGRLVGHGGTPFRLDPDLPAEFGLSKAARILASYLLIEPEDLDRWSTDKAGTHPDGWPFRCEGRVPVERWEFESTKPHGSFQMRLGRQPADCAVAGWYVTPTAVNYDHLAFHGKALGFPSEAEARQGFHDEALRMQRYNDPGRWHKLDPN